MGDREHFGRALAELFGLPQPEGLALAGQLLAYGAKLLRRCDRVVPEDLLGVAITRAWEQQAQRQTIENPYGWMATVILREYINHFQRGKRHRAWEEAQEGRKATDRSVEARQDLKAQGAQLRRVLDELSWEPTRSNGVHYFAVLLLALRLNALARYDAALDEPTCGALEAVVRWHEAEGRWRLNEELAPMLREYWAVVAREAQRSSLSLGEAVRLLDAELAPGLNGVWHQWRKRATKEARERCPAASWPMLEEMLTLRGEAA